MECRAVVVAIAATGALAYYELVVEPRIRAREMPSPGKGGKEPDATDMIEVGLFCSIVPAVALALGGGWWVMRRTISPVIAFDPGRRADE